MLRISPYSVRMRENADQNNSEYGHFSRSASPETFNDDTENTEENHIEQNEEKDCATLETFKNDPSRVTIKEKIVWICVEIQKIKEFQALEESTFTKLKLTNTTPVQPVELTTFDEVDMTPRQPEGMDTANKRVATSLQR